MTKRNEEKTPIAAGETQVSRRKFFGKLGTAAVGAAALSAAAPLLGEKGLTVEASNGNSGSAGRMNDCFNYRRDMAIANRVNGGPQTGNDDEARFSDFSGNYSKGLVHDSLGIPNATSYLSLKHAFETGRHSDFNNILMGTPGGGGFSRLNGPQGALAFDLEGIDSHCTVIPAAPSVASAQTAAEMVEHYWGALLADVPFSEYATNPLAAQAAADMNNLSFLSSSANDQFPYPVTPRNLFRGQFVPGDGNVKGPYVSQFMVQPAYYGSQFLTQQHRTFLPAGGGGSDYMTTVSEYMLIASGGESGRPIAYDPVARYLRAGRDLAAYTRVDVLYQGYFVAFLVLAGLGAALNPGNPYIGSHTQKGFGTLGGPDAAGTIGEMATRALKAAWFHKWIKDNRMRPEEYGALVQARKTNVSPLPQAAAALHADVLNSAALAATHAQYGSYLLPQAFPEGSPTHPCYPTGHGTVGGACTTLLKFFFNGAQKLGPLLLNAGRDIYEPSTDGLSLNSYSGADAGDIDINGELNKLAWNVSTGHGIHSGIHFRSSTYWSILLGEQVALSILQDRARSYNEPFSISIKKFDGTTATITNQ
jgi:hypothetical protein